MRKKPVTVLSIRIVNGKEVVTRIGKLGTSKTWPKNTVKKQPER